MTYPFTTGQVNRNKLVNYLSERIDDQGTGNKKRIRAAIDYAKYKGKIQVKKSGLVDAPEFFSWAVEKWPELKSIEDLPLKKDASTMHGGVAAGPATVSGFMTVTSNDISLLSVSFGEIAWLFSGKFIILGFSSFRRH